MSDQPRVAIRYNGGLWSVTLTNGEYSEHIPDFRTKEDAQFYADARFREWGYAPQPRHLHEYDADAEAALLAENRRLAERVEQLEQALIAVVNDIRSADWYHTDNEVIALVKATGIKHRHEREDGHG